MKKIYFLGFLIFISLVSCDRLVKDVNFGGKEQLTKKDLKRIKIDTLYALAVPKYMKKLKSLNDDASLQYGNMFKEAYIIVIDEKKQDFIDVFKEFEEYDEGKTPLENYSENQIKKIKETIDDFEIKSTNTKNINGKKVKQFILSGKVDDINVSYLMTFVDGNEYVFMIMSWTLKNRISRLKDTFLLAHSTFTLL